MEILSWANFRKFFSQAWVTGLTIFLLALFLSPFVYMITTSLKTADQFTRPGSPWYPAQSPTCVYNEQNLDVYAVPLPDGTTKDLGIVNKGAKESVFVDCSNPAAGEITWTGSYRSLDRPWILSPSWSNYSRVWTIINYPRLLFNTFFYAFSTEIGIIISCTLVAYGFSRFRYPGRDFLFIVLISTIFLPGAVTIIPTFTFFTKIGWVGTWLPLIIPSFFANPYDTFLLRQYFMTLPRELDESAMIDGASPLRVLWSVIIPQSYPALIAVSLFHIVWAWNDYFGPLLYLSTNMDAQPVAVALTRFNGLWGSNPELIQAGSLLTLIIPLILFFMAQRFFIQGIVITGVEK